MAKNISMFFDIPDISMFLEGNPYIGSENTFNFRIKPDGDKLRSSVWYGVNCFEKSEIIDEHEEEKNEEGFHAIIAHIDSEYEKYKKLVDSGEVEGRRTYTKKENN